MTVIAQGYYPICKVCGVEYEPQADGRDCTEPGCTGRVSWEATANSLLAQLQGAVDLLREARPFLESRHTASGKRARPAGLLNRIDAVIGGQ